MLDLQRIIQMRRWTLHGLIGHDDLYYGSITKNHDHLFSNVSIVRDSIFFRII